MRFNLDLYETDTDQCRSLTPKEDVDWVPLQKHPVFSSAAEPTASVSAPTSRLAWDGESRLYFWDSTNRCLHRITIRLGEPENTSVLAASPSKVLQPDEELNFEVHKISINRCGSALCLFGANGLRIMYLYGGHTSTKDNTINCRTVTIGSAIYYGGINGVRILQILWHPDSDNHLGVLSSDSVFRLFNLSSDLAQPEQEYYLQPVEPGRSRNASSICPVDFSFGSFHLWDRFSVFVLFSDGSIYILCPVVPFGSVHKWASVFEIYSDAQTFGLKSGNSTAVSNANMAVSWLEAIFPELGNQPTEDGDLVMLRAHPHVLFDASVSLQGPLRRVCHNANEGDFAVRGAECEGHAVSFLYNLVSKDSILMIGWSGGQLQIDALADEIQPVWNLSCPPRLRVDSHDNVLGIAMICESVTGNLSVLKLDQPLDHTAWLGYPPPLLRLAIVDLALPKKPSTGSLVTMYADPLMPERIYSVHDGGIDSIILHFLPFTHQTSGKDDTMRTPSVNSVVNACQAETSSPSPLCGFVSLSDSFGYSWILGVTSSQECILQEMKTWNLSLPNFHDNMVKDFISLEEAKERETPDIFISKELLGGPKVVLVPQTLPNLRAISADSIEGRSMLHQYFKLFHENYVEYAHKVYFELKHHGPHLKRIIDHQHTRLGEAQQKLLKVEEKQSGLEDRIDHSIQKHNVLEERLQRLRKLTGALRRPLSKAEQEFKCELDQIIGGELDALHSSIDTLTARLRRHTESLKSNSANQRRQMLRKKTNVPDSQISQLKSSLEQLSLINTENSKKVKILESTLSTRESSGC